MGSSVSRVLFCSLRNHLVSNKRKVEEEFKIENTRFIRQVKRSSIMGRQVFLGDSSGK